MANQSKTTPGPWNYDCYSGHVAFAGHDGGDHYTFRLEYHSDMPEEIQIANSNLIAAAPDLLFALSTLVSEIKYLVEDGTLPSSAMNHPAVNFARNAIDRAKG